MKGRLKNILKELGCSKLNNLHIDVSNEMITLDIAGEDSLGSHRVVFEGVNSFCFLNGEKDQYDINGEILVPIGYCEEGLGEFIYIDEEEDLEDYVTYPNFAVNTSDSTILIEAETIKINDKKFKLKGPWN